MALKVIPYLSPRIVLIPKPSVNESVQNLTNEIKDWEDEPSSLSYLRLVSTAGKENLGGGVTVGITGTLQNAQVAFDQRPISVSQGNVTTTNTSGNKLIDAGATFITDGVQQGASIINFTDGSVGTVLNVASETEIDLLTRLEDGTDNQFDISDEYKIWNIIQVEIDGGNLVAVDDLGSSISPIFPTFGTQVVRTSSSSATLQDAELLQDISYLGEILIDTINGVAGTELPLGNQSNPVNNLPDAVSLSNTFNFRRFKVRGDVVLDRTFQDYTFVSFGGFSSHDINLGNQNLNGTTFSGFMISGVQGGGIAGYERCLIDGVSNLNGDVHSADIKGTISLAATSTCIFDKCHSNVPGTATPVIDFQGNADTTLQFRQYSGGLELRNITSPTNLVSIDLVSGNIIIDSSCTSGTIVIRGIGTVTNNSTSTVITSGLLQPDQIDVDCPTCPDCNCPDIPECPDCNCNGGGNTDCPDCNCNCNCPDLPDSGDSECPPCPENSPCCDTLSESDIEKALRKVLQEYVNSKIIPESVQPPKRKSKGGAKINLDGAELIDYTCSDYYPLITLTDEFVPVDITEDILNRLLYDIDEHVRKSSNTHLKNLYYDSGSCDKFVEEAGKLKLYKDVILMYYKALKEGVRPSISDRMVQVIIEKIRVIIGKKSRGARNDITIDDSGEATWLIDNPYCVGREKWEELAYFICEDVGLNFIVEKSCPAPELIFDVTRNIIPCDTMLMLSIHKHVCDKNLKVNRTLDECKIDYKILQEKVDCDLSLKEYINLVNKSNLSCDIITNIYANGLKIETTNADQKDECFTVVSPTYKYSSCDLGISSLLSEEQVRKLATYQKKRNLNYKEILKITLKDYE